MQPQRELERLKIGIKIGISTKRNQLKVGNNSESKVSFTLFSWELELIISFIRYTCEFHSDSTSTLSKLI
jgi:hypothetical protein